MTEAQPSFWRIGFGHLLIMLTMMVSVVVTYMKMDGTVTALCEKTKDNTEEIHRLQNINTSTLPAIVEMKTDLKWISDWVKQHGYDKDAKRNER